VPRIRSDGRCEMDKTMKEKVRTIRRYIKSPPCNGRNVPGGDAVRKASPVTEREALK